VFQSGGVADPSDINWTRNDWIECEKRALNFLPFAEQQVEAIEQWPFCATARPFWGPTTRQ